MLQALQFAESLIQPDNDGALGDWLLATLRECWQPQGVILGLCDYSGRLLACTGYHPGGAFRLELPVDDFGHPLAGVVHDNAPHLWETLNGGGADRARGFSRPADDHEGNDRPAGTACLR
ncbi:hypothetical protein [Serratia marcescens]|uniref:hypothetical protein n=1 Tax=Serratia marcescens TaxID=615 RepID=UPI000E04A947|nr:hypothetical protein [Serratia marcescens]SUJ35209.1 Uncharacterised protein [Serratia marcescens]